VGMLAAVVEVSMSWFCVWRDGGHLTAAHRFEAVVCGEKVGKVTCSSHAVANRLAKRHVTA